MEKPKITFSNSNFLESNTFYRLLLGIVIATVTIVRWPLADMPLERDEGEYAYFGQLILNGVTPYQEAYSVKLPGVYYMYAFIMAIFGETQKGIHLGLIVMNAGTMFLLFLSMKQFFSRLIGIITAGLYGLMAMSYAVLGFAAHATHFAVFFMALALVILAGGITRGRAFPLGAMLGMAFLMKQQAVYFVLFGGILLPIFQFIDTNSNRKLTPTVIKIAGNMGAFSLGVFVPYILILLIMLVAGALDTFWFWTVQYGGSYAAGNAWHVGSELLSMTFSPIWNEHKWIYYLAFAGVIILFVAKFTLKQRILGIGLAISGILATTPGFYFRSHYFVMILPGVALMAALSMDYAGRFLLDKSRLKMVAVALPVAIVLLLFTSTFLRAKDYYSPGSLLPLCKAMYGASPFAESIEIAKYIQANSFVTDKIAVLGSEPQIAFYAHRRSATGYIYTYGLMDLHENNLKMQEEMISEIEKTKPLLLIFVNVYFSWLRTPDSPRRIFEWYEKYVPENYDVVGLVDIPDQGESSFYWNDDAQRRPLNQNFVWVFKRKI